VEHLQAVQAGLMASTILEADERMRSWLKHGHTFPTADDALMACRALLFDAVVVAHVSG
jgi:hypothetical protein